MTCDKCKFFKVLYEPLRTDGTLWDMGRAICNKHKTKGRRYLLKNKGIYQIDKRNNESWKLIIDITQTVIDHATAGSEG